MHRLAVLVSYMFDDLSVKLLNETYHSFEMLVYFVLGNTAVLGK